MDTRSQLISEISLAGNAFRRSYMTNLNFSAKSHMKSWLTLGTLYLLVPNALVHYFCLHCCCDIRLSSPFRNALFIVAAVYASSLLQYSSLLAVTICASHRGCDMCFSSRFRYMALLFIENNTAPFCRSCHLCQNLV